MRNITDTGIRGYLQWLKEDQPELYRLAAPVIANRIPGAFSDHEQSQAMGYLSDTTGGAVPNFLPGITPYSGDDSSYASGASGGAADDVSSVANVGAASPAVGQDIVNIIGAFANAYNGVQATKAQIEQLKLLNQQQLARATSANTPIAISSSSLGIPIFRNLSGTTIAGMSGGALLAIGAVVGLLFFASRRRAA